MSRVYMAVRDRVKASPALSRLGHLALRAVPDIAVTRDVPEIGRVRFGLRRHRWLLGTNCLGGHAMTLGGFRRLVAPGDVFYDVGANIGYYAMYVLRHFPVGRLVAFEPMTANVQLLRDNVRLNGYGDRVRVFDVALGDTEGREELQVDDFADGSASLTRVSGGEASEGRREMGLGPKGEMIDVRRLDDVIDRESLPPPQVIKSDTEGAEALVLRGARRTLERYGPKLAISLHGDGPGRDVLDQLDGAGYACFGFVREGMGRIYRQIRPDDVTMLADNNVLCSVRAEDLTGPILPVELTDA